MPSSRSSCYNSVSPYTPCISTTIQHGKTGMELVTPASLSANAQNRAGSVAPAIKRRLLEKQGAI